MATQGNTAGNLILAFWVVVFALGLALCFSCEIGPVKYVDEQRETTEEIVEGTK